MRKSKNPFVPWLFMAPMLIILGVFLIYPIVCGAALAFFDFSMLRCDSNGQLVGPKWVGLANFRRLCVDPYFACALKNSLLYVLMVPFLQVSSIFMAWLLRGETLKERMARTILYIPAITSTVVLGLAWKWLLRHDGLFNQALAWLSFGLIEPLPWLTDPKLAIFSLMMVTSWQGLGYYLILYLAGLQAVPKELEEQAALEGASSWQILLKIILPLLKPTAAVCTLLSVISALKVFTEVFIITGGGPQSSTLTASYYIYVTAFENFDMGGASAAALVLAAIIGTASLIHYLLFKEGGWESA
ncbi:MAG: carbohydrate ABC transporter permease [Candidatus Bruticola sp.]